MLKRRFLNNDPAILRWVEMTNGSAVELDAFNLYDLLVPTIRKFEPFKNHFYDREIRLVEMDRLVSQLKRMRHRICAPQVNELFLSFHLKALHYLSVYAEPGNVNHTRIAEASMQYIADYYRTRAAKVPSALCLAVTKQLNLLNWLPGRRAGATYGVEVMKAVAAKRMLTDPELKLYAHYLKIFDPQLKSPLPMMYDRAQIQELWVRGY